MNRTEIQDLEDLKNLNAGDPIRGVDQLVKEIRDATTFDVDYNNVYSDGVGYLAEVYVADRKVVMVDALNGDPMIRKVWSHKVMDIIRGSLNDEESEVEKMMDKEGIGELELDMTYNTLSIVDESGGDVRVTISLDLIRELVSKAENLNGDVYTVQRGQ